MPRLPALVAVLLLAAAPAWGGGAISVVTTTTDLKSLVEAVGGDRVSVESLAPAIHDPHTVEVKPGQLARLREAALLVRIGLDHEPWLARPLRAAGNARLLPRGPGDLDVSPGVELLQAETVRARPERGVHVHGLGNTHYWLDPNNAWPITATILAVMSDLRPSDRGAFEANREAFLSRLKARIAGWDAMLAPYRGARIMVAHDSWSYFAEHFGLKIVAAAEPHPGIPPSPGELAALLERLRNSDVRVLIADPHSDPSLVRQIADKAGIRAVTLLPSGRDYIALFEDNVQRLAQALKSEQ